LPVVGCAIGRCRGSGGGRGSTAERWELGGLILRLAVVDCSTGRSGGGVSKGGAAMGAGNVDGVGVEHYVKGGAFQRVEVAGEMNELDRRQDRFYRCSLYVASFQDS
jgi:hypothetical protein